MKGFRVISIAIGLSPGLALTDEVTIAVVDANPDTLSYEGNAFTGDIAHLY